MQSEKLGIFEQNIENACFGSNLLRNISGIEFIGPHNWKQMYVELRQNNSNRSLLYSQLIPHEKKLQRDLSVFDNKGNNLVIIPSHIIQRALSSICDYYIYKAWQKASTPELKYIYNVIENPINFNEVFCYDDEDKIHENINLIYNQIKDIVSHFEEQYKESKSYLFIQRIFMFINIYRYFYIPFVELETPIKNLECYSLEYSIEKLTKKSIVRKRFYIFGFDTISIRFEIEKKASNHIKILSPHGILFLDANVIGLKNEDLIRKYQNLNPYLDENMIYFNIPEKDSVKIVEEWGKNDEESSEDLNENDSELKSEGPLITINIGTSKKLPHRLSLMMVLIILMYVSIFIPTIAIIFFNHDFVLSNVIGVFVLTLTIIIALGIYSMDKPFLVEYVAVQIVIVTFLLILEIIFLSKFF